MLTRLITWSLDHRFLVVVLSLLLVIGGGAAIVHLPLDAFPDTTPVQVQVNTVAPALSPLEIEQQVTLAVERAMGGVPNVLEVRSISKFGLSQVTVLFNDNADIYLSRQLVSERLGTIELPAGIERPSLGPLATGLGEVFHYLVTGNGKSLEELTTLHDWVIKPQMQSVPGVAEVNTWGGLRKQYHVLVDPTRLVKYELTLDDLAQSLRENNSSVGGGVISQSGEQYVIHGVSLTTNLDEIGNIVVKAFNGVPVRIRDVANVEIGHEIRRGAATADGKGEVVLGLGFMLMGENSREVTQRMEKRLEEIKPSLPQGVDIRPVYRRTDIVDKVIHTVRNNLFEGALLVIAVLFAFLGNLRAGLIVALAIPLSMLFAGAAMIRFGIAGSLMSLGAIDFGLIVDSSVIMVENSLRRLSESDGQPSATEVIRDASLEVRKPTMFGELIIMIVYLPILTLEGVEGKLFRPMALTVIFALVGSMILSLTLMPVLTSLLLPRRIRHGDNPVVRAAKKLYQPVLSLALRRRGWVLLGIPILLATGIFLASRLGAEFIPRLSEMDVVINAVRLSGVSLEESVRYGGQIEKVILDRYPNEVYDVWTRSGTAEIATDPMGIELSDIFITLRPRDQWKRATSQDELVEQMAKELGGLPGMRLVFTQPIEMRVNEMTAGIRADLGVKLFGDDLEALKSYAERTEAILKSIPGNADVYVEQITGQPVLEIQVDQGAIARYGVPSSHVLELIEALGGLHVGQIREGQKRFEMVVRMADRYRRDPESLRNVLVMSASGERIPLSKLTHIRDIEGPSTVTHEAGRRRIVVQCNVRGRDVAGFVEEVRRRVSGELQLPAGYFVRFGGQFEHLERAGRRLMIVVPLAIGLIFILLMMTYRRVADVLRIFMTLPLSAVGGIAALALRGMPLSISAAVGFIAMSGVAVLGDMVFVSHLRVLLHQGLGLLEAIEQTALTRLRPVLMTGLVAGLGFVPMALSTGVGAEVQRPLATVVIGGILTSTVLTLVVLPAIYALWAHRPTSIATPDERDFADD